MHSLIKAEFGQFVNPKKKLTTIRGSRSPRGVIIHII